MKHKISRQQALILRDMHQATQYSALPADKRVQVKMPTKVVEALDELFPDIDRSQIITKLALDAIVRKLRFADNPNLAAWQENEQVELDNLWDYLEERERGV